MAVKIMRSTKYGTMPNGSLWEICVKCKRKLYFCYVTDGICNNCKEKKHG